MLLRHSTKSSFIVLTDEFRRDLNWFCEFVPKFNGSAFFVHAFRAKNRLKDTYSQSTSRSYFQKFKIIISFCCFASIFLTNLTPHVILVFLEFITFNKVSRYGFMNYLSAVKTTLSNLGLNIESFNDPRIKVYNKTIMRHAPVQTHIKTIIDIEMLAKLLNQCDRMYIGSIFKAAFLTSFFSFLRISNLVPHSMSTFDPMKQLARADVIFAPPGAHLIAKWSKTLQFRDKIKALKIPSLGASTLCPVATLKTILRLYQGHHNSPLFQIKCFGKWVPLTDTRLRKFLSKILHILGCQNKNITFHSFRCSAATLAFNSNIPMQHIQSHGTWTSDAVWGYIIQDHEATNLVATTFQNHLSTKLLLLGVWCIMNNKYSKSINKT